MASKKDPRVDKRRVTMSAVLVTREDDPDNPGQTRLKTSTITAVDYVRPDILDAYVTDARNRWSDVDVSAQPDAGPGGYDGPTYISPDLDHPLANSYFPASDCKNCKHAPEGATVVKES